MRVMIPTLGLLLASPALAAEDEISVELGVYSNNSESYGLFSEGPAEPVLGLRGGYAIGDHFAVVGGLSHGWRGARAFTSESQVLGAAYSATELSAGLKVDTVWEDTIAPYVLASAMGWYGVMRFDDDTSTRLNPGQVRSSALSLGGRVVGGAEMRFARDAKVRPAVHMELGWAGVLPHTYSVDDVDGNAETLARMGWSGLVFRMGGGVRF